MKKGFTLVEMLVVIGIIGVLAGALIASLSGGSESARAARCLANMKNLANACQTYAMKSSYYPLAGNLVYLTVDESRGVRNVQKKYTEVPGWISGSSKGMYPGTSYSKAEPISMYSTDDEEVLYAFTNGVLWKYVSGNRNTYLCPLHVKKAGGTKHPHWSYLMNSRFGWDQAGRARANSWGRIEYGRLDHADKILLFSEIPFAGYNTWQPDGEGGSEDTDSILQYSTSSLTSAQKGENSSSSGNEEIGVNHTRGKREAYAHVAFADGHTEKLRVKVDHGKPDTSQMKELTSWLCAGLDVSFDGKEYQKIEN